MHVQNLTRSSQLQHVYRPPVLVVQISKSIQELRAPFYMESYSHLQYNCKLSVDRPYGTKFLRSTILWIGLPQIFVEIIFMDQTLVTFIELFAIFNKQIIITNTSINIASSRDNDVPIIEGFEGADHGPEGTCEHGMQMWRWWCMAIMCTRTCGQQLSWRNGSAKGNQEIIRILLLLQS